MQWKLDASCVGIYKRVPLFLQLVSRWLIIPDELESEYRPTRESWMEDVFTVVCLSSYRRAQLGVHKLFVATNTTPRFTCHFPSLPTLWLAVLRTRRLRIPMGSLSAHGDHDRRVPSKVIRRGSRRNGFGSTPLLLDRCVWH